MRRRLRWTIASIPVLIGLGLIYLGVATGWDTLQLQWHGESTRGQVTDRTFAGKQKIVTVRFTTSDGRVVAAADHGRLLPDSGTVDVRYDRRDPQRIRIGDWQSFYLKAGVLGGGGVVLLAIAAWILTAPRRRRPPSGSHPPLNSDRRMARSIAARTGPSAAGC